MNCGTLYLCKNRHLGKWRRMRPARGGGRFRAVLWPESGSGDCFGTRSGEMGRTNARSGGGEGWGGANARSGGGEGWGGAYAGAHSRPRLRRQGL